jgi:hypothetical protein
MRYSFERESCRYACTRRAATLTRPFGATSPIEREVRCMPPPLHLSPGGRVRTRKRPGEGGTLRLHMIMMARMRYHSSGIAFLPRGLKR